MPVRETVEVTYVGSEPYPRPDGTAWLRVTTHIRGKQVGGGSDYELSTAEWTRAKAATGAAGEPAAIIIAREIWSILIERGDLGGIYEPDIPTAEPA